jgi:hypothetical protein
LPLTTELPAQLRTVLAATGYVASGGPASGVILGREAQEYRRSGTFRPDAVWTGGSSLRLYFKYGDVFPDSRELTTWHREVWNEAFVPMLWVVGPGRLDVYNGFSAPTGTENAQAHLLRTFSLVDEGLAELDAFAGRLAMETGLFWRDHGDQVNRKTAVDRELLRQLQLLDFALRRQGFDRATAQGLIGRVVFTQFLVDRGIVTKADLEAQTGRSSLSKVLSDSAAAASLFTWMSQAISGDMFPSGSANDVLDA